MGPWEVLSHWTRHYPQDGGTVSGFVYFQSVTSRESAVQFQMNLVDASDGTAFGVITIPFQSAQG